jgi:hypothetical protein
MRRVTMFKRINHKLLFILALTTALLLALTSIALADEVTSDVDFVTANNQDLIDLGNVGPDQEITAYTSFQLVCSGSNHADLNDIVHIQYQGATIPSGGNLTAGEATIGPIPASWPVDTNGESNCPGAELVLNDNGNSAVQITTPTSAGTYDYIVSYRVCQNNPNPSACDGIGANDIRGSVPSVTFRLTVVTTDSTPPTATPTQSPAVNGAGWNNTDVTVTWNWTDNAGGSGIDIANCTTSSTSSGEGEIKLSATCKDLAGNIGSADYTVNVDKTAPEASPAQDPAANANGWNNSDVTVTWNWSDSGSGIDTANCTTSSTSSGEGEIKLSATCKDLAGNTGNADYTVNVDKTAPEASPTQDPAANANGWNNSDVTVTWNWSDSGSGIDTANCTMSSTSSGEGEIKLSATCKDLAGNTGSADFTVHVDKTAPIVELVGGPEDGASYYFGFVPAAPSCSASDALSGLDGDCSVSGYGKTVGTHTVTASAKDKAGNTGSASRTYTVLAWTLTGFFHPVDMPYKDTSGNTVIVLNTVKNGSTVPLKFTIFAGTSEITDTDVIKFTTNQVKCDATAPQDPIETTATGGTTIRYDPVAHQFVFNWQTPKIAGNCYRVTLTTDDGSTLVAYFKLK